MAILLYNYGDMKRQSPYLMERKTGRFYVATIRKIDMAGLPNRGWNFNWHEPIKRGYDVYALTLEGNDVIQGLVAIKDDTGNKAVNIDIIESAPHNVGSKGKYEGVGALLFAFAGNWSIDLGYRLIYFDAKTNLIEYYKKRLKARQIGNSQRMILEGSELNDLVGIYYSKDGKGQPIS